MTKNKLIQELEIALKAEFGLRKVDSLEKAYKEAVFCRDQITLAGHYSTKVDMIVLDGALGSLGLVHVIEPGPYTLKALKKVIQDAIKEATYIRQILVTDPHLDEADREKRKRRIALTVELVLVTEDDKPSAVIGELLQELAAETQFLRLMGVHHLPGGPEPPLFLGKIRRAFCWLLHATRLWYESSVSKRKGNATKSLARVTLENFRLQGKRIVKFDPEARVHLVGGRNGTGKSALAESLELIVTGELQRLVEVEGFKPNYEEILTNRNKQRKKERKSATVVLKWNVGKPLRFKTTTDGIDRENLQAEFVADSFRLNQRLIDRLVLDPPPKRAETFLRAFFAEPGEPGEMDALDEYGRANADFSSAIKSLDVVLQDLKDAKKFLGKLKGWTATGTAPPPENVRRALDEFLEVSALSDVLRWELILDQTILAAKEHGWEIPENHILPRDTFRPRIDEEVRRKSRLLISLESRCKHLKESLEIGTVKKKPESQAAAKPKSLPYAGEIENLNRVGELIIPRDSRTHWDPLGHAILEALQTFKRVTVGKIEVGKEDWTAKLIDLIDPRIHAIESLKKLESSASWPEAMGMPPEFKRAAEELKRLRKAGKEIEDSFLNRVGMPAPKSSYGHFISASNKPPIGLLNAALNEVMALFTPARWAFEDIAVKIDAGTRTEGGTQMRINLGEGPQTSQAELILNTAELNLFIVTLFLLCAVRRDNPYNFLVLDDPLQNMDAMTVTMLARGLAKIMHVWEKTDRNWNLLLLFHGANDVERFREEMPAAVYTLPWLSPGASKTPKVIPDEVKSMTGADVQSLIPLLQYKD